jgi:hypothetical protein
MVYSEQFGLPVRGIGHSQDIHTQKAQTQKKDVSKFQAEFELIIPLFTRYKAV